MLSFGVFIRFSLIKDDFDFRSFRLEIFSKSYAIFFLSSSINNFLAVLPLDFSQWGLLLELFPNIF
jgi:hypothetical protein